MSNANGLTIRRFVEGWAESNPDAIPDGLVEYASRPGTDETNWLGFIYVNGVEVRYFDTAVDPETGEVTNFSVADRR